MSNNYYKQEQVISELNRKGTSVGKIEKWKAHRNGVLHKALTIALVYKGKYIIQHRKHPAFDGVFDITSSSHQVYSANKLQNTLDAVYECLRREWGIEKKDLLGTPVDNGSVYYKAKDAKSNFKEHEICEILIAEVKKMPNPNYNFAYGFSLASAKEIKNKNGGIYNNLAPWVKKMIKAGKF